MTSCGGGGDDGGSRPTPAVVYDDLVEVREHAAALQNMLQGSPSVAAMDAGELVKEMMGKLSSAMSVLGTSGVVASSSGAGRGSGARRRRSGAAAVAGLQGRRSSRRRTKSPFIKMVTTTTLNDDNSWRKYGQKNIHASTNPRSYYRCTHKPDQGCMATRQVQKSESNPSELEISYYGQHTCRDPSTFPSFIVQGAAAPTDGAQLISFAPNNGAAASTSTGALSHRLLKETMDHRVLFSHFSSYSSSPTQEGGAPSSSPSPACQEKFMQYAGGQLADVLGRTTSTLTVGSAPTEYWPVVGDAGVDMDAAAGMVDSFPSSPSSLGFMSGSLGSFGNNLGGDDDLFDFDS
ncbi:transcription factor WRKY45-2-like [Lolium rigidum]|uniref:transcription factor WRKY45-2-like n=1 Tax=Lolium rigidum TaxID=89674 RepID=UPI001F5D786C|nr:transcription factor WRKY45-2-like [Lolium rigidum]